MVGCLIIHGFTGGPYEVDPLADYLKKNTDWHIEVPTLPGHGRNLDLKDVSYKKWIRAAEDSLKKLKSKYDKINIIGFSMGGMIASYLASKYKVENLVLLAPSGKFLSIRQLSLDIASVAADGMRGNLKKNKLYVHYKKKMGTIPFKANIEFIKLIKFTRKYLKKVTSPVLIAQGQQDGMVPYKTAYYLDKELKSKQKEVVFFERSRHLICLGDDKDLLNKMVYEFLMEPKSEKPEKPSQ
ncbi:esterase/lipase [Virgibacillus natechei]|uniref:Esterase/lipase n=1 Tax=Virgibacillus natechei TaxID=1216297 RepID=A0ABS4IKG3_9BACI|nr:alpha/beta fold hydrolase [Virgibacillus natechei]MBP1971447.1 esterase/lipase [Virgibacillus natechei]UZD13815.1 alpha/beta fold hydrolase [Virgibacillus natechei]